MTSIRRRPKKVNYTEWFETNRKALIQEYIKDNLTKHWWSQWLKEKFSGQ